MCLDGFFVVVPVLLAMDCALLKTVVAVGGDCVLVSVPDPAVFAVM